MPAKREKQERALILSFSDLRVRRQIALGRGHFRCTRSPLFPPDQPLQHFRQVEERMSMAYHAGSRVPFLDHRLVELAAKIPSNVKFQNEELKRLRTAFADRFPRAIPECKDKVGFPVPLRVRMKRGGRARGFILDPATKINRLTGNPAPFLRLPRRARDHSGKRFGSAEKSRAELEFEAGNGIDDGLRLPVEWTTRNFTLIQKTIRKHDAHMRRARLSARAARS